MLAKMRQILTQAFVVCLVFMSTQNVVAYEVAVSLGSTADWQATIDMGDSSKWPIVADSSWGVLANLVPIAWLERDQQEAVFRNFKIQRAITELPYNSIDWTGTQGDIAFIESFGLSVPYVFVIDGTAGESMLTREELLRVKDRFADKKIIMNTHSWVSGGDHVESVKDVLDGVCIEYFPHNERFNVAAHVAPFGRWAYENEKILMFLMPPLPDEDQFAHYVTELARIVYEENSDLPKGWMKSDQFIFSPANYTFGASSLAYVPEDDDNTVLGAAKALLMMRPELDAGQTVGVIDDRVVKYDFFQMSAVKDGYIVRLPNIQTNKAIHGRLFNLHRESRLIDLTGKNGQYFWNGKDNDALSVPGGLYILQIMIGGMGFHGKVFVY
ncbi:MAG: hypothetical protein HQK83_13725 [Fibrobacteria bacterium]|nr:hypothetical protein [Fibrobacteria bacterium]